MNHQRQSLLSAIKAAAINRHLLPLLQIPQPRSVRQKHPFEVYQYEQKLLDYDQVQANIKNQIIFQFNNHLYEEECSSLQMQLFALQKAIQIEQNQISLLKLQIEAQRVTAKTIILPKHNDPIQEKTGPENTQFGQQCKQDQKQHSHLRIYPCMRVDFDPPKMIPRLQIASVEQKQVHTKSHRQLIATYTKRSQSSNIHHLQPEDQENNITIKQAKQKPLTDSLAGLQRQISFLERSWREAKREGQSKLCREYKKQLMSLVAQFWRASGR